MSLELKSLTVGAVETSSMASCPGSEWSLSEPKSGGLGGSDMINSGMEPLSSSGLTSSEGVVTSSRFSSTGSKFGGGSGGCGGGGGHGHPEDALGSPAEEA